MAHAPRNGPADICADMCSWLMLEQAAALPELWNLLNATVAAVIPVGVEWEMLMFGSRALEPEGGYGLPSSDFDVVAEVDQAIYQHMGLRRLILLFHAHLQRDARVTGLRCITRNHTVTLKLSGVIVEFTVCLKPALSHHRPYMATNYMRAATDHVSSRRCADLMRLVVDWAKHKQICPRKRDGYVGNRLKACIWSLLVLAWWTYHIHHGGPDFHYPIELGRMVYEVIRFYAIFPFETLAIAPIVGVAVVEEPFVLRPTESTESHPELVLVCDPIDLGRGEWSNLAGRIDTPGFVKLVDTLRHGAAELGCDQLRDLYFRDACWRWAAYQSDHSSYAVSFINN